MSLALYAAEFNEDPDKDKLIEKKRQSFKRRIGMTNKMNKKPSRKAALTLNAIHSNLEDVESEEKGLAEFNPIEPPESSGVEKTKERSSEEFRNKKNNNEGFEGMFEENGDEENGDEENVYATQYYNQYIPPAHLNFQPGNEKSNKKKENIVDKDLDEKLNYLIELIEQQKGEKTDNITEEILLYGLVGIFVIYVVDSFITIGKYKR